MSMCIDVGALDERLTKVANTSPYALIYHQSDYIKLVARQTKSKPAALYAYRDNQLCGALPYLMQDGAYGPVYNSLAYFGSNGGAITCQDNPAVNQALAKAFFETAKANACASATLITNPLDTDVSAYENSAQGLLRDSRIGQITHFPANCSADSLLSCFDSVRRRNIRKAIKSGVTVRHSRTDEDLRFLFEVHKQNITAIGGLHKRRSFFEDVKKLMPTNRWSITIADYENKPVAALLLMFCNKTVEYYTPAIVEQYRNLQPLALLIFESMLDAANHGYLRWNWGGTWLTQTGVYQFKKKWGTTDHPYHYYSKVYNDELLRLSPAEALETYPNFYLFPFNKV